MDLFYRFPKIQKFTRLLPLSIGNTFSDFNTVFELYAYLTRHVLWLVCTGVGSPPFTFQQTCTVDPVATSRQKLHDISHCFAFLNWIEDWIELRGLQHRHSWLMGFRGSEYVGKPHPPAAAQYIDPSKSSGMDYMFQGQHQKHMGPAH